MPRPADPAAGGVSAAPIFPVYVPTDNAGHTPEVGDYVAYNWSGQIATGYIVSVGRSRYSPQYRIEQVLPGRQVNHSRVTGSRNVLVLQKGNGELSEHPA